MEVNDAWKKFNGIIRESIEQNIPNYKGPIRGDLRQHLHVGTKEEKDKEQNLEEISQTERGDKGRTEL